MTDRWTDRLSEYLDDSLSVGERRELEAHLDRCEECSRALEELRAVVARAGSLDDTPPERDLWPGIAAQIAGRGVSPVSIHERRPRRRRVVTLSIPQLVAAALALFMVGAGSVMLAGGVARDGNVGVGGVSQSIPAAPVSSAEYDAAVRELEQVLQQRRSILDPATVAVVERNLETIDRAIAEARVALADDPSNTYLNTHLARTMRQKVDLLRRAVRMLGG